jgi:hypothetical protein
LDVRIVEREICPPMVTLHLQQLGSHAASPPLPRHIHWLRHVGHFPLHWTIFSATTVVHKKWSMHRIWSTLIDRPHNNSSNTSEFSDEKLVWAYLFCSVA